MPVGYCALRPPGARHVMVLPQRQLPGRPRNAGQTRRRPARHSARQAKWSNGKSYSHIVSSAIDATATATATAAVAAACYRPAVTFSGCFQQGGELFGWQRAVEVVALSFGTVMGLQESKLLRRFDAFRDDVQLEALAHGNDRADDGLFLATVVDILYEGLVNFQRIDRKACLLYTSRCV